MAQLDESIDELISKPINVKGVFTIRNGSGQMVPASLCGKSKKSTFAKTYDLLKAHLEIIDCMDICDLYECETEQVEKLESVLASLSDVQFLMFVKILASSPRARHRMYLSICALVPGELEDMRAIYQQHAWNAPVPFPFAFPMTQPMIVHDPKPKPEGMVLHHSDGRHSLHISFSIDDVDGARDLLVKIAHKMSKKGFDPSSSNIILLQQFASLCQTVSKELLGKWESKFKWPESWKEIDEVTLDLRRAYAPDGVYLPTAEWLQNLKETRDATPRVFITLVPTGIVEERVRDYFNPETEPFDPEITPSHIN